MSILTIPLEISTGAELEKGKSFNLGIKLIRDERYEICISSLRCIYESERDNIYTLYCDALDQNSYNPSGTIMRFTQHPVYIGREWYLLDTYDLDNIIMKLEGKGITSISITLMLRKYGQKSSM